MYCSLNSFLTNVGLHYSWLKFQYSLPFKCEAQHSMLLFSGSPSEYSMMLIRATLALFTCIAALHGTHRHISILLGRLLTQGIPHLNSTNTTSPILDHTESKLSTLIPLVGRCSGIGLTNTHVKSNKSNKNIKYQGKEINKITMSVETQKCIQFCKSHAYIHHNGYTLSL